MSRARCGRGGWFIGWQCSERHGGVGLRAIRAPTLLLIGDAEKLYEPQAMLKLAQRRMPGLEAAIVPGADHIAAMSQPEDVNGQIIRFLQKGGADKNGGR
jgi:pimeloyl-ACP methyl ester carboxylesterase